MSNFFSSSTINSWVHNFDNFGNIATAKAEKMDRKNIPKDKALLYVVRENSESLDSSPDNSLRDAIYDNFSNVHIARQLAEYSILHSVADKCYDMSGILQGLLSNAKEDKVLLDNNILGNIDKLLLEMGSLKDVSARLIPLTSDSGICRKYSKVSSFLRNYISDIFDLKYFELRARRNEVDVSELNNASNAINLNAVADAPEDIGTTSINMEEKGTRNLIGNISNQTNSNIVSSQISSSISQDNNKLLKETISNLEQLLFFCQSINTDTDNIIFNMNIRFRNATLNENSDKENDNIYNLSNWLFAFQKQIVYQLLTVRFKNMTSPDSEDDIFNLSTWLFAFQKQVMQNLIDSWSERQAISDKQYNIIEKQNQILSKIEELKQEIISSNTVFDTRLSTHDIYLTTIIDKLDAISGRI